MTADDAENKNIDANWQYHKAYIKNVAAPSYTVKAAADYDNPIEEVSFSQLRVQQVQLLLSMSALCKEQPMKDYTSIDKLAAIAAQQTQNC